MRSDFDGELEQRLTRYAAIDTQSDETSATSPSTARQLDLLHMLRGELAEIGAADIRLTGYGALIATLPASPGAGGPAIALLAHVDTAPQFHADAVRPLVRRNYDGGALRFPDAPDLVLSPTEHPYLAQKIGHDIVTASGATLLGADDKAGVAIVMTAARHLLATPSAPRGEVRVVFTPDEEIGRGVHADLPADMNVAAAYTFDGAERGEIVYESFSADKAVVRVLGVSIHPGWAKDKLVNALTLAARIADRLGHAPQPETTEGREGFIHLYAAHGSAAEAEMRFILRDFERDGLAALGDRVRAACDDAAAAEPRARIACEITPQYRNMRYWLEDDMRPVELAREACRQVGVEPFSAPIRGGTDGSRLTEMGVPTPNVFTGMQNVHGPLEWVSVQDMADATRVAIALVELWAEQPDREA
jgi:tripeptide aminopeptidase